LRRLAEPLGSAAFWPGLASPEQVSTWLQAADIFVLPQTDGHLTRSGAFMAAGAHGLPVIAVRNDAEQQYFGHREDVYLVESSSAPAFAAAIAEVAADAGLRTRLGANLRRLYFSRFDWPHLISSQRDVQTIPGRLPGAVATPPMKSKG
jgi:glycosyltransferase involved in cell wall biosynthesis